MKGNETCPFTGAVLNFKIYQRYDFFFNILFFTWDINFKELMWNSAIFFNIWWNDIKLTTEEKTKTGRILLT